MRRTDNDIYEEVRLLTNATEMGVTIALRKLGLVRDEIAQREAYRRFGEGCVKAWVRQGIVKPIKVGLRNSKVTYSLSQLETVVEIMKKYSLRTIKPHASNDSNIESNTL